MCAEVKFEAPIPVHVLLRLAVHATDRYPSEPIGAIGITRDHRDKKKWHLWYNTKDGSSHIASVDE